MFKIKKIKPMFDGVVTTAMKYVGDQYEQKSSNLIIDTRKMDGTLNSYQRVIAVGETVRNVKEGDIVMLNFDRYLQVKHVPGRIQDNLEQDSLSGSYSIPMIYLEGYGDCLYVHGNDIVYVVEDYEVDDGGLLQ